MTIWFELECISCGHVTRLEGDEAWRVLHEYNAAAREEHAEPCDINSRIQIDGCHMDGCVPTYASED